MPKKFAGKLDPSEVLDYSIDFRSQPADPEEVPILADGESIDSYTIAVTPEAALYGLTIRNDGAYAPSLDPGTQVLTFWLEVDDAYQANSAFTLGVLIGVEVTIITDSVPARTRQRTFLVDVRQL